MRDLRSRHSEETQLMNKLFTVLLIATTGLFAAACSSDTESTTTGTGGSSTGGSSKGGAASTGGSSMGGAGGVSNEPTCMSQCERGNRLCKDGNNCTTSCADMAKLTACKTEIDAMTVCSVSLSDTELCLATPPGCKTEYDAMMACIPKP